tara:strand:- start:991 stop:1326 length:336 start_codon:yes stop_codon:yes gene_type:complete
MCFTQDQGEDSEMNDEFAYYEDLDRHTNRVARGRGAQTKPKTGSSQAPSTFLMKRHEKLQSSLSSFYTDKENETPNGSQTSLRIVPNQHPIYGDLNEEKEQPKMLGLPMKV